MSLHSIPTLINIIFTLGLALFVLYKGHRRLGNKAFTLAMGSVGIMEFGNFMILNASNPLELLFWGRVSLIGCCLIPAHWALFILTFGRSPDERITKKYKLILLSIYALSFSSLIFIPSDSFITIPPSHFLRQDIVLLGTVGKLFSFFLLMSIVFIMVNLEAIYRNSTGAKRWQIKYAVIGIFAAFIYYIYVISKIILFRFVDLSSIPIGSVVIFICSGLLAYSFVRHRLMNIDVFISRQVFYGSFTVLVISAYLILIGFIGEVVKILNTDFNRIFYPIFVLVSLVALSALFLSEKNRKKAKKFIDRHFYRNKFDYRFEWIELTNRISSLVNVRALLANFMDLVAETMCVGEIMVWLYNDDGQKFQLVGARQTSEADEVIAQDSPLIKYLSERAEPFSLTFHASDEKQKKFLMQYGDFFERHRIFTLSPLMVKDKLIGFLSLGEEVSGADYNYEDYDMLKTMCHQAAHAIMNIQLAERLALSRAMGVMNKVSSFVLHDLKNSISMLSLIIQNASHNMDNPEFQKDVLETIAKTIENMKELMARMASLPKKMTLNKTKTNLIELLKDCLGKIRLGNDGIELAEKYAEIPLVEVDQEKIQSVIRNLILNALEALKNGGKISLSTFVEDDDRVIIEIKDNGPGMAKDFLNNRLFKPFQTTKRKGLGIGLYQCKAIISAHGGEIKVESQEGQGAQFRIYLPV